MDKILYNLKFEFKKLDNKFKLAIYMIFFMILIIVISYRPYDILSNFPIYYYKLYNSIFIYSDLIIPVLSSFICFNLFKDDYIGNYYELIPIYIKSKYNILMFFKLCVLLSAMAIFSIIIILIHYTKISCNIETISNVLFIHSLKLGDILMKTIPTVLWYTVLPILLLVLTNNTTTSTIISIVYISIDILGSLYLYPFVCTWSYNINTLQRKFYIISSDGLVNTNWESMNSLFIVNRVFFIIISFLSIIYILKKSMTLKMSK